MKKIILAVLAIGLGSSAFAAYASEQNLKGARLCLLDSYETDFDSSANIDNTAFGLKMAAEIEKKLTLYRIPYQKFLNCTGDYYLLEMTAFSTNTSPSSGSFAYAIQFQATGYSFPKYPGGLVFYDTTISVGLISKDIKDLQNILIRNLSNKLDDFALAYIKQNP